VLLPASPCHVGFSAQSVFFPLYIATFNALWAAYPTLGYGLFEQVSRELPCMCAWVEGPGGYGGCAIRETYSYLPLHYTHVCAERSAAAGGGYTTQHCR